MKSLRALVLTLAVGTLPGLLLQAHAQQEVDPDHFDEPIAQANVQRSKAQNQHKATAAHNQNHGNVKLAGKHAASKSHHHAHVA